jgi:hypothetical protein
MRIAKRTRARAIKLSSHSGELSRAPLAPGLAVQVQAEVKLQPNVEDLWQSLQEVKQGSIDELVGAVDGEIDASESERKSKLQFQKQVGELLRKKEVEVRAEMEKQYSEHAEVQAKALEAVRRKSVIDREEEITSHRRANEQAHETKEEKRERMHEQEMALLRSKHEREIARVKVEAAEETKQVLYSTRTHKPITHTAEANHTNQSPYPYLPIHSYTLPIHSYSLTHPPTHPLFPLLLSTAAAVRAARGRLRNLRRSHHRIDR